MWGCKLPCAGLVIGETIERLESKPGYAEKKGAMKELSNSQLEKIISLLEKGKAFQIYS